VSPQDLRFSFSFVVLLGSVPIFPWLILAGTASSDLHKESIIDFHLLPLVLATSRARKPVGLGLLSAVSVCAEESKELIFLFPVISGGNL
jgi:hypothetical protein